jgi:hypothetical protein
MMALINDLAERARGAWLTVSKFENLRIDYLLFKNNLRIFSSKNHLD